MKEFRVAIVGCGHVAALHADIISKLPHCTLIAVADIDTHRATALAEMYAAKAYSSLSSMLREETLDVVHICTPSNLHTSMVRECAAKGLMVFCEKPGAISKHQLDELDQLAKTSEIAICFQNRFVSASKKLLQVLHGGSLGAIQGVRAMVTYKRDKAYYERFPWRSDLESSGGGALMNQAILTLDLMVQAMGKGTVTEARIGMPRQDHRIEVEESIEAYIDFSGRPGLLYASGVYSENAPTILEFHCEKARLRLEGEQLSLSRPNGQVDLIATGSNVKSWHHSDLASGHYDAIAAFYEAVIHDLPNPLTPDSVGSTLRLVYDIYNKVGRAEVGDTWHDLTKQ